MQPGAVAGPQQDQSDLQYWLSWDLITDGPAFSAEPSSLDGTISNPSSLEQSLDNSVNTSPSTLFADVMDSPNLNFSSLNTNANSLFPPSAVGDEDGLFDYNRFYQDHSKPTPMPARRSLFSTPQAQITSISPQDLQAPQPQQQVSRIDSQSTEASKSIQSDCGDSDYAGSRRSSTSSDPPSPRPRAAPRKKRSSVDSSGTSSSKRSKRPGSVVDKKYRDKLKDKMAELKRTVPTVRAALDGDGGENGDGVAGLMPASNSRKPTILTKAIEYIHYLEDRNENLSAQLAHVRPQVIATQ